MTGITSGTGLLDVRQMKEADRLAIAGGTPGIKLMENAGRAVAREIMKRWRKCRVSIMCGPGNNGGDGFAVARILAGKGWKVRVGLLGKREDLKGEAAHHARLWRRKIEPLSPALIEDAELVVDALFGAGLSRKITGAAHAALAAADKKGIPIIAVDVPSGVLGDSGESLGAVAADVTVTFFRKKPGHLLLPGKVLCGETVVADIGISSSVLTKIKPDVFENDPSLWKGKLPALAADANKYTRGHALIYGGYLMTGAGRLAAHAAARMGSGLTMVACPEAAFSIYASSLASLIIKPVAGTQDMEALLSDKRLSALLIGPGAGITNETRIFTLTMLASGIPIVLDADALSVFKEETLALKQAIRNTCIMTPHEGEFARIFDFKGDKLTRARDAAKAMNAIIILKGSDTVIAAPDGRAIINSNAPSTLATGGTGDVLSGFVLGLLAQKMDPFFAAAAAVWLHGAAACTFGPCLIADDLPDMIPQVFHKYFSHAGKK